MTAYKIATNWECEYFEEIDEILEKIEICQKNDHVQQVAYSTFEQAFTQVCFNCQKVRTTR